MEFKDYNNYNGNTVLDPNRKGSDPKRKKKVKKNRELEKRKRYRLREKKIRKNIIQIVALVALVGTITITRDMKVYKTQKDLANINKEIKVMTSENEALEVELLKTSALGNIEATAKTKLNMTLPTKENMIDISK
ncbi:cell division protein FtsL [Clostridium tarantellae]|uniref:Cell division protein FtsL n=1 Tax=Clostridium tarantellae TaxID=39493 RepID=A0A6I1MJI5_9CLOT|nr:cell division protein FtsL [Clostridium tarantellae]MPQ43686.1 cell division protein FtsL [Clostridium tarantellae]